MVNEIEIPQNLIQQSQIINQVTSEKQQDISEKEMIERALERHAGRRKAAAAELNISERTLYRKIREYGIE